MNIISNLVKGIGTDIIEIARIQNAALKTGSRFINRIYTQKEIAFCTSKRNPWPSYAARFSAKEAVFKALGTGVTNWHDVEILKGGDHPPTVCLAGIAAERAKSLGVSRVLITISHDKDRAIAFAMAIGEGT